MVMTPIPEPDQLPGSPIGVIRLDFRDLPSGDKLLKLADQSPAGRSERHYLRASTLSFDGQLVVSIYVNVILEGHYVRLLIRPYVLQPLVFDLVTTADLVAWNPLVLAYYATTMTIRGFLNLAARIGRGNDETGKAGRAKPAKAGLRSTRESYARPYVNNIHQAEDSSRIAQVLEEKIFTATMEFLRKRNIDIEDYQRQIQSIMLLLHDHGRRGDHARGAERQPGGERDRPGNAEPGRPGTRRGTQARREEIAPPREKALPRDAGHHRDRPVTFPTGLR